MAHAWPKLDLGQDALGKHAAQHRGTHDRDGGIDVESLIDEVDDCRVLVDRAKSATGPGHLAAATDPDASGGSNHARGGHAHLDEAARRGHEMVDVRRRTVRESSHRACVEQRRVGSFMPGTRPGVQQDH
ncbi:MAG TPA: hypothetical protein VNR62_02315, partial [Cellulomonas sp.]|nr:hypothetical protein [Cellulomonas sp.]